MVKRQTKDKQGKSNWLIKNTKVKENIGTIEKGRRAEEGGRVEGGTRRGRDERWRGMDIGGKEKFI